MGYAAPIPIAEALAAAEDGCDLVCADCGEPITGEEVWIDAAEGDWLCESCGDTREFSARDAARDAAREHVWEEPSPALRARLDAIVSPSFPDLDEGELTRQAVAHYNAKDADFAGALRGESNHASLDAPQSFLDRISVNYVRHCLTDYDHYLSWIKGQSGEHQAIRELKRRLHEAVAEAYPWLADECDRQVNIADEADYLA